MRKSILAAPLVAAAAALTLGMGAAAQASVVGSLSDSNGTAGYYTQSFADTYTQVNGTFALNKASLDNEFSAINGAIGIQLCNDSTGYAAQLGVIDAGNGEWAVGYWKGYLNKNFGVNGGPCDGNIIFGGHGHGGFTALGTVGAGTTVQAQIKEVRGALVYTVADSNLANFNYAQKSYPGFFNEAAAGVSTDLSILSAPATNDLVDFTGVTTTDVSGATHGFAYWNTVAVTSGPAADYPQLIVPSAIAPSGYTCTTVPGHWKRWTTGHGKHKHHHKRWIKAKTTCTGGGASSFSIDTGTPIGY